MPFKSKSQKAKFAMLVKQGKMSKATFDEWDKETKDPLPDKVPYRPKGIVRKIRRLR
jgi:hypothetical protein